jgi:hypothetical protein
MADANDEHNQSIVVELVEDPVVPDPDPPDALARLAR